MDHLINREIAGNFTTDDQVMKCRHAKKEQYMVELA